MYLVLLAVGMLAATSATAQTPDDKLVVPGQQIGALRLNAKLPELIATYGRESSRGPGGYQGAIALDWSSIGLTVNGDARSGNLIQISIRSAGSNQWSGFATGEGVALETPQEKVIEALGAPTRSEDGLDILLVRPGGSTSLAVAPRGLYYLDKGIVFGVHAPGIVKEIAVHRPIRAPGDTLVVPGERISGVRLDMPQDEVLRLLGGGFVEPPPGEFHYWPHTGHYVHFVNGRVAQLQVTTSKPTEWARIRYATAQGLGFKSTPDQVRRLLGEAQGQERAGRYEAWIYRSLGILFVFDHQSPDREVVIVGVGPRL